MDPWYEEKFYDGEEKSTVEDLLDLARLTERQRFVIELRHGFRDGKSYTQQEIADFMGIDRSVVSRHESAAKKKLKKVLFPS